MIQNDILRMLETRNIWFNSYDLPPDTLSATETASFLNIPPEKVYKSIIISREKKGKPILSIVPGPLKIDLKKLSILMGEKKLSIPPVHKVEQLTGLEVGGISPLALMDRGFEMILDYSALHQDQIYISGGQRGLILLINVKDLITLVVPKIADISNIPT